MKIKVLAKGAKIGSASFEYEPGYEFISDPACSEYDWLVVYDELHTEGPVSAPRAEGGAGTSRARPSSNEFKWGQAPSPPCPCVLSFLRPTIGRNRKNTHFPR